MFAGLHEDTMLIRLSEKDCEKVPAIHEGVHPFEPMKGRIMKEYVVLAKSLCTHSATFNTLLNLSHQYVASLPPKTPKKKTS
jgi:hypothetical protein